MWFAFVGPRKYASQFCIDVWSHASGNYVVSWGYRAHKPENMMLQHNCECIISSLLNLLILMGTVQADHSPPHSRPKLHLTATWERVCRHRLNYIPSSAGLPWPPGLILNESGLWLQPYTLLYLPCRHWAAQQRHEPHVCISSSCSRQGSPSRTGRVMHAV